MKLGILAGEASGDLLGAGLISELRKTQDVTVTGIGGPAMMKQDCQSLFEMERLSIMGFYEPLKRLPELLNIRRGVLNHFTKNKPDVFVGIDSPDFNLGIELKLRKAGIPVVHYVSPSVWAWRHKRIHKIAKATDLVLTLFPFEAAFYEKHQVRAHFVGHPLADAIPLQTDKIAARLALNIAPDAEYIALLPGSRRFELKNLAELFIATAKRLLELKPHIKFITSAANDLRNKEFQELCQRLAPELPIHFFIKESHKVMAAADVVLVTSGTATLETMLFKRPMVIVYRVGPVTYQIAKRMIKLKYIGLPNLLANESLVPEFIQDAAQPNEVAKAVLEFLNSQENTAELIQKFSNIHHALRRNANQEAARAILSLLS